MKRSCSHLLLLLSLGARLCFPGAGNAATTAVDDSAMTIPTASVAPDTMPRIRDTLPPAPLQQQRMNADVAGPPSPPHRIGRGREPFFQSPTGKLLRSVAFPGWGQWSNGKKKKAVIYFGIETYFFTKALIWRHRALDRLHTWERTGASADFYPYNSARDRRGYFYWLTGVTIFVSMFDAYSDAYLLTLERTRNMGDEYWGGQSRFAPDDEVRLAVTWRF